MARLTRTTHPNGHQWQTKSISCGTEAGVTVFNQTVAPDLIGRCDKGGGSGMKFRRIIACLATLFFVGGMADRRPYLAHAAQFPDDDAARVDALLIQDIFGGSSSSASELAAPVDDQVFLRRVWLDLVGEAPPAEEITRFCFDPSPYKRGHEIDRLLADQRFGANWARYWRDVILYRRSEERALFAAVPLQEFLQQQLNENQPWDQIAREFVTANGDVREDGSTALIMAQAGRPEETVAEISRIFMGIQIQCAQCHDHPTDRWKREQFHELVAFFPRVAVRPNRAAGQRSFMVVADDNPARRRRANNNNRRRGTLEHYMPDLDDPSASGTLMQPALFVTGQQLDSGLVDRDRRQALAEWMTSTDNPWFAKAIVNRLWAELVGEGFFEPVDDIGPDRVSSAPQALDYLAETFVQSGHDLKWLFRTIMSTEAYQRQSRPRRNYGEAPFTANRAQRLRGDQLYSVLVSALNINERSMQKSANAYGRRVRGGPRAMFNAVFGYDPSERREEVSGSIPQTLVLMNSTVVESAISARRTDGLGGLLNDIGNDSQLVTELYLRCLSRQPSDRELRECLLHVKKAPDRSEGFEDVLWTLINSTEFLHRR